MTLSRRSFLQMAGVASVAYAITSDAIAAPKPPGWHGWSMRQALLGATASFYTIDRKLVGPRFLIPDDWWEFGHRSARLRGKISCPSWPGPICTLAGMAFLKGDSPLIHGEAFGAEGARVSIDYLVEMHSTVIDFGDRWTA